MKLLDLCCGTGGATRGYQLAGFHVTGVDINPQPNYCGDVFIQGDAIEILRDLVGTGEIKQFAASHGSPPCQLWSLASQRWGKEWPDLIGEMRQLFIKSGLPWVIENVRDAPLERSIMLCGTMFGLKLLKHRYFESNIMLFQPQHPRHTGSIKYGKAYVTVAGHGGHGSGKIADWQEAMGIDWTRDRHELAEAIPPAYTEWVGKQFVEIARRAA